MRRFIPRSRRRVLISAAVAVAVAVAVPAAALAVNYWGYNYISSSSPSGACYYSSATGIACANLSASSSQVDKAGGDASDYVVNAFRNGSGDLFKGYITDTISAFSSTGHDPAEGPTCYHWGGSYNSSYIQCRYFNGF